MAQRPAEHPLAERAPTPSRHRQHRREMVRGRVPADRPWLDLDEGPEAFDDPLDRVEGGELGLGPSPARRRRPEHLAHEHAGPIGPCRPRLALVDPTLGNEPCDVLGEQGRVVELGRPLPEPVGPLLWPAHDAGAQRDARPPRRPQPFAVGPKRRRAHPPDDRSSPEVVVGQREGSEQRAPGHRLRQRPHRGPVHRDRGGGELLVEQPGIRLALAIHDADAVQRAAELDLGRDDPHRLSHLSCGIGCAHGPGRRVAARQDLARRRDCLRGPKAHREPVDQLRRVGIGLGFASEPDHGPQAIDAGECVDEVELRVRKPVREMQHHLTDVAKVGLATGDRARRRDREVVLVVEGMRREGAEALCDRGELTTTTAAHAQRVDRGRTRRSQLVEELDHRALGVLGRRHTFERRRPAREHLPDQCRLHRIVEGPPPRRCERARAEQLGEAIEHEEPHVEQTVAAPPELAPEGQAGQVAGHHHGHGSERVTRLRRSDRRCQGVGRRRPEGHGQQARCALDGPTRLHVAKVARGCDIPRGPSGAGAKAPSGAGLSPRPARLPRPRRPPCRRRPAARRRSRARPCPPPTTRHRASRRAARSGGA